MWLQHVFVCYKSTRAWVFRKLIFHVMSDLDTKYLVFGYITAIESKLSDSIIPNTLKQLCFEFYFIIEEFGDHGNLISLNKSRDVASYIESVKSKCNTVYGIVEIDPSNEYLKAYKWTLQLLNYERKNGFYLGIDSSNKQFLNKHFTSNHRHSAIRNTNPFCAFTVRGQLRSIHLDWPFTNDSLQFNVGDIVMLILDLANASFKIMINNDETNSAVHENVIVEDIKYRLAITLQRSNQSVKLIKYETERY